MTGERLLVVDDEENLRSMLRAALRHHGFDVTLAANGREALEVLGEVNPDFVVLDVMMPDLDAGWEDTVLVTDDEQVVIAARFNTYSNPTIPYMYHCHILDHKDTGMMGQFRVVEE